MQVVTHAADQQTETVLFQSQPRGLFPPGGEYASSAFTITSVSSPASSLPVSYTLSFSASSSAGTATTSSAIATKPHSATVRTLAAGEHAVVIGVAAGKPVPNGNRMSHTRQIKRAARKAEAVEAEGAGAEEQKGEDEEDEAAVSRRPKSQRTIKQPQFLMNEVAGPQQGQSVVIAPAMYEQHADGIITSSTASNISIGAGAGSSTGIRSVQPRAQSVNARRQTGGGTASVHTSVVPTTSSFTTTSSLSSSAGTATASSAISTKPHSSATVRTLAAGEHAVVKGVAAGKPVPNGNRMSHTRQIKRAARKAEAVEAEGAGAEEQKGEDEEDEAAVSRRPKSQRTIKQPQFLMNEVAGPQQGQSVVIAPAMYEQHADGIITSSTASNISIGAGAGSSTGIRSVQPRAQSVNARRQTGGGTASVHTSVDKHASAGAPTTTSSFTTASSSSSMADQKVRQGGGGHNSVPITLIHAADSKEPMHFKSKMDARAYLNVSTTIFDKHLKSETLCNGWFVRYASPPAVAPLREAAPPLASRRAHKKEPTRTPPLVKHATAKGVATGNTTPLPSSCHTSAAAPPMAVRKSPRQIKGAVRKPEAGEEEWVTAEKKKGRDGKHQGMQMGQGGAGGTASVHESVDKHASAGAPTTTSSFTTASPSSSMADQKVWQGTGGGHNSVPITLMHAADTKEPMHFRSKTDARAYLNVLKFTFDKHLKSETLCDGWFVRYASPPAVALRHEAAPLLASRRAHKKEPTRMSQLHTPPTKKKVSEVKKKTQGTAGVTAPPPTAPGRAHDKVSPTRTSPRQPKGGARKGGCEKEEAVEIDFDDVDSGSDYDDPKPFECEHGCGHDGKTRREVELHEAKCTENVTLEQKSTKWTTKWTGKADEQLRNAVAKFVQNPDWNIVAAAVDGHMYASRQCKDRWKRHLFFETGSDHQAPVAHEVKPEKAGDGKSNAAPSKKAETTTTTEPTTKNSTEKNPHSFSQPITLKPVEGSDAANMSFDSKGKACIYLGISSTVLNEKMRTALPINGWHVLASASATASPTIALPPNGTATAKAVRTSAKPLAPLRASTAGRSRRGGRPVLLRPGPSNTMEEKRFNTVAGAKSFLQISSTMFYSRIRSGAPIKGWFIIDEGEKVEEKRFSQRQVEDTVEVERQEEKEKEPLSTPRSSPRQIEKLTKSLQAQETEIQQQLKLLDLQDVLRQSDTDSEDSEEDDLDEGVSLAAATAVAELIGAAPPITDLKMHDSDDDIIILNTDDDDDDDKDDDKDNSNITTGHVKITDVEVGSGMWTGVTTEESFHADSGVGEAAYKIAVDTFADLDLAEVVGDAGSNGDTILQDDHFFKDSDLFVMQGGATLQGAPLTNEEDKLFWPDVDNLFSTDSVILDGNENEDDYEDGTELLTEPSSFASPPPPQQRFTGVGRNGTLSSLQSPPPTPNDNLLAPTSTAVAEPRTPQIVAPTATQSSAILSPPPTPHNAGKVATKTFLSHRQPSKGHKRRDSSNSDTMRGQIKKQKMNA